MTATLQCPGRCERLADARAVAEAAATHVEQSLRAAIEARGEARVALSGGTTPRAMLALLAGRPIPFERVRVFQVDERAVPLDHERSNARMIGEALTIPARMTEDRVHWMAPSPSALDADAARYASILSKHVPADAHGVPCFDVIVLGVGDDGHTASLFPGDAGVRARDALVVGVAPAGEREARLSLTAPVLEAARSLLVLVSGRAKREALGRAWALEGDVDVTPARLLAHARGDALLWLVDEAADPREGAAAG